MSLYSCFDGVQGLLEDLDFCTRNSLATIDIQNGFFNEEVQIVVGSEISVVAKQGLVVCGIIGFHLEKFANV